MKIIIKLEELGFFVLSFVLFLQADISWWWFLLLLMLPDISIAAYFIGPKTGAQIYNVFHHRGLAILLIILGYQQHWDILFIAGTILFAHASLDRIFGYGLKLYRGFKFTHLGEIGNK